jgi:hypothetical protein
VRQPPHHAVARSSLAAAAPAPAIVIGDPARQHRPTGLQALPGDFKAQLVQAAERGQVRASEGSVKHVEVFLMGSLRTPIIGRPRPLPRLRRAADRYTLICDEPVWGLLERESGQGTGVLEVSAEDGAHHCQRRDRVLPVGGQEGPCGVSGTAAPDQQVPSAATATGHRPH